MGIPAEFISDLPREVALTRLAKLKRWKKGKEVQVVGVVKPDLISIRLLNTFIRTNGTRFEGTMVERAGTTAVMGRFIASSFSRVNCGLFLSLLVLFAFSGLIGGLHEIFMHKHTALYTLCFVAFLIVWLASLGLFALMVIWNATPTRKEVAALSKAINAALAREST